MAKSHWRGRVSRSWTNKENFLEVCEGLWGARRGAAQAAVCPQPCPRVPPSRGAQGWPSPGSGVPESIPAPRDGSQQLWSTPPPWAVFTLKSGSHRSLETCWRNASGMTCLEGNWAKYLLLVPQGSAWWSSSAWKKHTHLLSREVCVSWAGRDRDTDPASPSFQTPQLSQLWDVGTGHSFVQLVTSPSLFTPRVGAQNV